jgi:hypothetical protein
LGGTGAAVCGLGGASGRQLVAGVWGSGREGVMPRYAMQSDPISGGERSGEGGVRHGPPPRRDRGGQSALRRRCHGFCPATAAVNYGRRTDGTVPRDGGSGTEREPPVVVQVLAGSQWRSQGWRVVLQLEGARSRGKRTGGGWAAAAVGLRGGRKMGTRICLRCGHGRVMNRHAQPARRRRAQ